MCGKANSLIKIKVIRAVLTMVTESVDEPRFGLKELKGSPWILAFSTEKEVIEKCVNQRAVFSPKVKQVSFRVRNRTKTLTRT